MEKLKGLKQFQISKDQLKAIVGGGTSQLSGGNACLSVCTRGCDAQSSGLRDQLTCYVECKAFC